MPKSNNISHLTSHSITGGLLARNTLLNFIGQAVPLLVGVSAILFVIRGLGGEWFGLLSLAWVVLGYFAIFDLGLGRATTKFVAEAMGKGKADQVPRLVWTAVTVQAIFGVIGGFILVGVTLFLVEHVLNVPPELSGEAKTMFYLLVLSIPVSCSPALKPFWLSAADDSPGRSSCVFRVAADKDQSGEEYGIVTDTAPRQLVRMKRHEWRPFAGSRGTGGERAGPSSRRGWPAWF